MLKALVLAAVLSAGAVRADVPTRVEAAFRDWAQSVGVDRAALTLWKGDQQIRNSALGLSPEDPMPLASLGKAITGVCAATLIEEGRWRPDTTAKEVLGYGRAGITVAQLLTHQSGLGPDGTQGLGMLGLFHAPDADEVLSRRAMARTAQSSSPGRYAYNNENYAILGAMIVAETGQAYQSYCKGAVLDPAGVRSAAPHAPIAGMLSFGGWEMSVQDYARFMYWAFGPEGLIGKNLDLWPQAKMGGGAFYGVGMVHRAFRDSHNFWHFGLLCFPQRVNAGSYAVSWAQEWRAVVAYDRCLEWDQMFELDAALSRAVFQ